MKAFKFLLPFLLVLAYYSHYVSAEEVSEVNVGMKGLAKERIKQFEKIIQESKSKEKPELKIVKRSKPYISKFPIEDGVSAQIVRSGDVSIKEREEVEKEPMAKMEIGADQFDHEEAPAESFVESTSSYMEDISDEETQPKYMAEINDLSESNEAVDPVKEDIDSNVGDEHPEEPSPAKGSVQLDEGVKSEVVSAKKPELTKKQEKKLRLKMEKENMKQEKKMRKRREKEEKERLKQEKERLKREKERVKQEEKEKLKQEKERVKQEKKEKERVKQEEKEKLKQEKKEKERVKQEEKEKLKQEKERVKQEKKLQKSLSSTEVREEADGKSSCSSFKGKKHKETPSRSHRATLEERLCNQDVASDTPGDVQDELSTVASENEFFGSVSSVDQTEGDILVGKPNDLHYYSDDDEEEEAEIKARILAGNENDFRTERMSSEEALQESDSDYLDIEDQHEPNGRYVFDEESEDIISKENAVKPLEGIEIEGISEEDDDDDAPSMDEAPVTGSYSDDESMDVHHIDGDSIELSHGSMNEDQDQGVHSIMEEDIGIRDQERGVDEDFSSKESKQDDSAPKEKSKSFFGRIRSFFKRKPKDINCKTPSCFKRVSKKDEPKYSSDFIPRIHQLSRNVPKESFYRVPEIFSSLRSESNRLVFAYQLLDGSLIPSSTLAMNSKSFIVRRWGKSTQNKLTKLRAEFDNLKTRLSSMYHEGVLKGEFELFIEEMDDLTIMLYLLAKEFPRKSHFANIAKDILRYPEVVSTPGEKLISMFRRSKASRCGKKSGEPKPERSESDELAIKVLRKRMKLIKKRLNNLGK
ncbi:putative signal peptide-containing protein [Cryptosporidium canis]|uniref:Signal peptide-containing protein n=1 Tax=Cryptosporidium canis TaxID=195482 RepID=A0A9D5DMI2_9CRYT|nr:putative signal peptide-containing protein [Cryptosporidium canis]